MVLQLRTRAVRLFTVIAYVMTGVAVVGTTYAGDRFRFCVGFAKGSVLAEAASVRELGAAESAGQDHVHLDMAIVGTLAGKGSTASGAV